MIAWLFLLVTLIVDAAGLHWWLRTRYHPVIFNQWALFLYSLLLPVDLTLAWVVSLALTPGGSDGLAILALLSAALAIIIGLFTLFFRWVIRLDLTDISKHEER